MKVLLFGATGMVGQGALRECLLDPEVEQVLAVGRTATGQQHAKLRELVHKNLLDFSGVEKEFSGYDACFFCLGISSAGMSEPDYRRVTYDMPMAAAQTLVRLNPGMTFIQPMHGVTSKTKLYRVGYTVMGPLYPLLKRLIPKYVTTTEQVGRTMLEVAKSGAPSVCSRTRTSTALAPRKPDGPLRPLMGRASLSGGCHASEPARR